VAITFKQVKRSPSVDPDLYQQGIDNAMFNYSIFISWVVSGAMQAMAEGLLTYPLIEGAAMATRGYMSDVFTTGTIVLGFSVMNSTWKVTLFVYH
jgi:hypothetical protein